MDIDLNDPIEHPAHYTQYKGLEIIDLTEQMNFNRGNAVKYIARAGFKDPEREIEDLEKARWYIDREIQRLSAEESEVEDETPSTENIFSEAFKPLMDAAKRQQAYTQKLNALAGLIYDHDPTDSPMSREQAKQVARTILSAGFEMEASDG